ncbi:MAG: hypothetical protein J7500_05190 [Sphingomonas sp.]|uniref:hypothetical protein n=1 Tax=Sphingomonas sp. TaxID=28214 RepID=UPI001B29A0B9|nr:hypothetical protein [Sphingomonas sp.]MBO9622089.1 hypothetical protein [Sphingomonas sp.]
MQGHLHGIPILLVERDGFCAAYVAQGLEHAGARLIGPYGTGEEALACLADPRRFPQAAVLDGSDADAVQLCVALAGRDIPFVVINQPHDLELAPACQGRPVFSKPFGAFQVVEAVELLAARARRGAAPPA